MPGARMFRIVAMMLIEPRIDDMPSRCTDRMVKSMPMPVWTDSGGYSVQPASGPPPGTNNEITSSVAAGGSSQNDQLLSRGSAMSGAPIIIGISQFANPVNAGITAPNTITSACTVVIWLKKCGFTTCRPGCHSSARMTSDIAPPTKNIVSANHRYSVPMSLWLVVNNQRPRPCGCSS